MCYFAVHAVRLSLTVCLAQLESDGIEFGIDSRCGPFVLAEPVIIVRVNDGVFALRQRDASEGVAVAEPAIQKYKENERPYQPFRNCKRQNNLDNSTPVI
jgi:hypothetical protein